jgi:hypothetical protein
MAVGIGHRATRGQILSPLLVDLVDWHRVVVSARQPMYPGGLVRQPFAIVDYIPQSGTRNFALEPSSSKCEGVITGFCSIH